MPDSGLRAKPGDGSLTSRLIDEKIREQRDQLRDVLAEITAAVDEHRRGLIDDASLIECVQHAADDVPRYVR